MTIDSPLISSSMRSAYKSCPRKVYYRYVAGIQRKSVDNPARAIGRAFHECLRCWRDGNCVEDVIGSIAPGFKADLEKIGEEPESIVDNIAKLIAYLNAYELKFGPEEYKLTEQELLTTGEIGFLDVMYFDEDDLVWGIEDKTCGQFFDDMEQVLKLDEQLLNYATLLRDKGYVLGGFRYRQTKKTRSSRKKGETASQFSDRIYTLYKDDYNELIREFVVTFEGGEIGSYRLDKARTDQSIRQSMTHHTLNEWQRNSNECMGKFGKCDYLPLCATGCDTLGGNFEPNDKEPLDTGKFRLKLWG